jgi:tetratricopeptide (TPR) repeat protein
MKNICLALILTLLLAACASSTAAGGLMSLNEAIDAAVQEIETNLPKGTEIVIYKIASLHDEIGEYLCNELNNRLVTSEKLRPLERENVWHIYRDYKSDFVDDISAAAYGYNLEAKVVITGIFNKYKDFSQLRLRVIDVETQTLHASYTLRISNTDQTLVNITAPFGTTKETRLSENALAHLNRGKDFLAEGKLTWDEAVLEFDQAIAINRQLTEAYYLRGWVYSTILMNSQAIIDFSQVILLEPNNARAYYQRGWAYSSNGDRDKAIADLSHAIGLDPNNPVPYNMRGIVYSINEEHDKAIIEYTHAIRVDPNFWVAYANRGQKYREYGDYDKAIADYTQLIRLNPNDYIAYNDRSIMYAELGDIEKAIADAEASLRIRPDQGRYHLDFLLEKQSSR